MKNYPDVHCMSCGKKIKINDTGALCSITPFREPYVEHIRHLDVVLCRKHMEDLFSLLAYTPFDKKKGVWLITPHADKRDKRWDKLFDISVSPERIADRNQNLISHKK